MNPGTAAIELEGLSVRYGHGAAAVTAADGVGLSIAPGTTHGLVGESGSGKSTLARAIVGLAPIVAGQLRLDGERLDPRSSAGARRLRPRVQMVFQNPYGSLNPRMTVGAALEEALAIHGRQMADRTAQVDDLLRQVGLPPAAAARYPHQFSGGQRQRVAIARALATAAGVLILDEVTSALDVSVQATILNLLRDLQRARGLSYLFISHDLAAVRYISDVVSVMYLGRIVETASRDALFGGPCHPYTAGLLAAVPSPRLQALEASTPQRLGGEIGDPRRPPSGCRFHPRCPGMKGDPALQALCPAIQPALTASAGGSVACHAPLVSFVTSPVLSGTGAHEIGSEE